MAYTTKYRLEFKDYSNNVHKVDLLEDGYTGSTIELKGSDEPFIINYPEQQLLSFKRSSGCDITLLSESNFQLIDLYNLNMFGLQIQHSINSNLNWCGYLDCEMYSEPYNDSSNYFVSISGNDGFNLLKRLKYIHSNGVKYLGIVTQWEILQTIINQLNLPFTSINIGISTQFTSGYTTTASLNVFIQTYINNDNYYNEDDEPENFETVLQSILEPYGATILQSDGQLWILDLQTLKQSTLTYKKYDSSYNYISTQNVSNTFNIPSVGYRSNSSTLTRADGINRQKVTFSPYGRFVNTKFTTDDLDAIESTGSWTPTSGFYIQTATPKDWLTYDNGGFRGSKKSSSSNGEYYIYWTNDNNPSNKYDETNNQTVATYGGTTPYVTGTDDKSVLIKFNSWCRVADNPYSPVDTDKKIKFLELKFKIKISDDYYDSPNQQWINDSTKFVRTYIGPFTNDVDNLADRWLNIAYDGVIIPLEKGLQGRLNIEFISHFFTYDENFITSYDYNDVTEIWIKDVTIDIVDTATGKVIEDVDKEYTGYISELYENEGEKINLICGTNVDNNPVAVGGLMRYDNGYIYINEWTRNSKTGTIEELLLNTITSNFNESGKNLTITLKNTIKPHNVLTDTSRFPTTKFIITGFINNLKTESVEVTLTEFNEDNLTFVRNE